MITNRLRGVRPCGDGWYVRDWIPRCAATSEPRVGSDEGPHRRNLSIGANGGTNNRDVVAIRNELMGPPPTISIVKDRPGRDLRFTRR